jgi:hypothetical protein
MARLPNLTDPQPRIDAHHEDDPIWRPYFSASKVTEREYGGYRNTHNPACVELASGAPLGQPKGPAKYASMSGPRVIPIQYPAA